MFNKKTKQAILAIDAIAFQGGSKIATQQLLNELPASVSIYILTRDSTSWTNDRIKTIKLWELNFLAKKEHGAFYYLRHLCISLQIVVTLLRIPYINGIMGTSGPGVDLSIYIAHLLLKPFLYLSQRQLSIIQLIHGPIASSRSIYYCLKKSDVLAYLPSTKTSISACLTMHSSIQEMKKYFVSTNVLPMNNGLSNNIWPSATKSSFESAHILWAASLLKWKQLDLFISSTKNIPKDMNFCSHICYIKPISCNLEQCAQPITSTKQKVYEQPKNLDEIRSHCNIFVSTSLSEPFGLSILEAMAAGLCVVIPADNAYWDTVLTDGVHCIKYKPNDADDLSKKLKSLINNMHTAKKIGYTGSLLSKNYQASTTYQSIVKRIVEQNKTQKSFKNPSLSKKSI